MIERLKQLELESQDSNLVRARSSKLPQDIFATKIYWQFQQTIIKHSNCHGLKPSHLVLLKEFQICLVFVDFGAETGINSPQVSSIYNLILSMFSITGLYAKDIFKIEQPPIRQDYKQPHHTLNTIQPPQTGFWSSFQSKTLEDQQQNPNPKAEKNTPIHTKNLNNHQNISKQSETITLQTIYKQQQTDTPNKIGIISAQPITPQSTRNDFSQSISEQYQDLQNSASLKVNEKWSCSSISQIQQQLATLQDQTQDPIVQLYYWPIRGIAERIRLILHYLGIKYQNKYFADQSEWELEKSKVQCPIIELPYLKDGDIIVVETEAIIKYLILKAGRQELLGRSNQQKVRMAEIRGFFGTFHSEYILLVYGDFDNKIEQFLISANKRLKNLEQLMGSNQYICGEITYVDFLLAQFFDVLCHLDEGILDQFPKLKMLMEKIWDQPGVADYIKTQQFLKTPLNSCHAKCCRT